MKNDVYIFVNKQSGALKHKTYVLEKVATFHKSISFKAYDKSTTFFENTIELYTIFVIFEFDIINPYFIVPSYNETPYRIQQIFRIKKLYPTF